MTDHLNWQSLPPLIAILRGVKESEIIAIGDALFDAGFRFIEIPLNSPMPLKSIEKLSQHLGDKAWIGAGTVLNAQQVRDVYQAGGRLIVSPNFSAEVVTTTKSQAQTMLSFPGVLTASECFAALAAGADGLKLFPAEASSPSVLKALRAVIPSSVAVFPVGGVTPDNMDVWIKAGASGFGLGSALYKAGDNSDVVAQNATQFMQQLSQITLATP